MQRATGRIVPMVPAVANEKILIDIAGSKKAGFF